MFLNVLIVNMLFSAVYTSVIDPSTTFILGPSSWPKQKKHTHTHTHIERYKIVNEIHKMGELYVHLSHSW